MAYNYIRDFYAPNHGQVSGLGHLEGLSASVIIDGSYIGDFEVSGGAVQLPEGLVANDEIIVGLGYEAEAETMPSGFFTPEGPIYGQPKRIASVGMFVYQSLGMSFQFGSRDEKQVEFREQSDDAESAPPLLTGFKEVNVADGYTEETTVKIKQTQPYPLNINLLQVTQDLTK
jgi:hypothetical protein